MSSTQHQLIEQCATRLRGIVEALDNIHDTSPHRWSTDLDDVHSSAESLLALIKDQAPTQAAQDLALRTIAEYPCPEQDNMTAANMRQVAADAITGALAFGAEGQRTLELAMLVRMLASSLKRHAPESNLVARATNYLAAKGLAGTPLRDAPASVEQAGRDVEPAPCPFCGGEVDPTGWLRGDGTRGPECNDCGATARSMEAWQTRTAMTQPEGSPVIGCLCGMPMTEGHHSPAGCSSLEEFATHSDQAQHSVPEGYALIPTRETEAMHDAVMALLYKGVARTDTQKLLDAYIAAAPGKEVPQAWHDVQAERRRQIEAEGWTPEHDDEHSHGQMARAAACYALAGSSAPNDGTAALLVSLAWPWDEQWWKPTSARGDLVKACALALAEIERLDRAGISQNPQPGATTASS
ncbi:hypothetical protein ACIRTW_12715 [Pseudomonas aeruginosa]|nr:hypothetical protein [Pseudomonas aeruginosa]ACD38915.1 hypothetical phage protein [Pseudomonas aeruginosa]EZO01283.1 hypothetical protein AJ64_04692 [Pseudomonas aeruginosa 3577]MCS7565291.1 hypothetical protein [Pseudomonas aeruginosa]HBP5493439.1 hypothetical protein [Pseudomonas aeruginosa]